MTDIFTAIDKIPNEKEDPEFWKLVGDPNLKKCLLLLMLNELRKYPIESLTDQSSRSMLAKLKGYQELIDLTSKVMDKDDEHTFTTDDPFLAIEIKNLIEAKKKLEAGQ